MQYLKSKSTIALGCCLVVIGVLVVTTVRRAHPTKGIYSGSSFRWSQILNIHQSPSYWLMVDGQKYHGVIGRSPYYLDIPSIGGIFFVTRDNHHRICHFWLKPSKHIAFDADDTYLGLGIGSGPSDSEYDVIYESSGSLVLVGSKQGNYMIKYEFDLKDREYRSLGRFPIDAPPVQN